MRRPSFPPLHSSLLKGLALVAVLGIPLGCAKTPEVDPRYRPAENVLEVIAVLRRHVPDDTYRFPPARDFTGRNVYRSSLLRLESLQQVHADALRAGHLDGAIAFAKARALERVRGFELAAEEYRFAAKREESLAAEATRSAEVCAALAKEISTGLDLADLASASGAPRLAAAHPDELLEQFERRAAALEGLVESLEGTHHQAIAREELERTDVTRARVFTSLRHTLPGGDVRAISELRRVVERHHESKEIDRHLLRLADLYRTLSSEYLEGYPPQGLSFDPARFQELVDSGARLYEVVASRDGSPEKLEAGRKLEAFLAFALRVDRDRFTP